MLLHRLGDIPRTGHAGRKGHKVAFSKGYGSASVGGCHRHATF